MGEAVGDRFVAVAGESLTELAQGVGLGGLGGGEQETAVGTGDGVEEEGLALASPSGDHAQRGLGAGVVGEAGQFGPFEVAVEHLHGLGRHAVLMLIALLIIAGAIHPTLRVIAPPRRAGSPMPAGCGPRWSTCSLPPAKATPP